MCIAAAEDGTPTTATSYSWIHVECNSCFYDAGTQNVTVNNLQANDSGGMICTANVDGIDIGTEIFTLRISGRLTKKYKYSYLFCILCSLHTYGTAQR